MLGTCLAPLLLTTASHQHHQQRLCPSIDPAVSRRPRIYRFLMQSPPRLASRAGGGGGGGDSCGGVKGGGAGKSSTRFPGDRVLNKVNWLLLPRQLSVGQSCGRLFKRSYSPFPGCYFLLQN